MGVVHLSDAKKAKHYLNYLKNAHHRNPHQGVHFEMEENTPEQNLLAFNDILDRNNDLEELRLSYYENKHLT